ncbi:hypothetical protein GCK32_012506 [Trichostrongylus colubriformis]|uniref:Uncharacterized protein n=1 Tax=Trichostrongylus colubriformis TaxID=6319 RepID=A0AAN8ET20_TRICO
MPLSFLLKARDAGADMDTLCKEVKAEQLEVFDASGNQMDFLGCMETKMELVGGDRGIIQMHVKRLRDEVVLLEQAFSRTFQEPGFDPVYPSAVIPSSEISPYRIDIDDYKSDYLLTRMPRVNLTGPRSKGPPRPHEGHQIREFLSAGAVNRHLAGGRPVREREAGADGEKR